MTTDRDALRLVRDGNTLDAIADVTGLHKGEIVRIARENGLVLNASTSRFEPVRPLLKVATTVRPGALAAVEPTVTAAARPVHRDLIDEGKESSVLRIRRAAIKAEQALGALADLLEQTRRAEAARRAKESAEAERLARIAELKAELAALTGRRAAAATVVAAPKQPSGSARIVRTWASANGVDCPARGPIPQRVVDAYLAAAGDGAA